MFKYIVSNLKRYFDHSLEKSGELESDLQESNPNPILALIQKY